MVHRLIIATALAAATLFVQASSQEATPLQPLVDATEPNATLLLEPGIYAGPVYVETPITIDGQGHATVDGGGKGSVFVLDTDGAQLRNLHITNSGSSHNDIDAGVQVRGDFNVIKDNVIDHALFGVDLQQSSNNIVRRNKISSHPVELGLRGDAIRLWYSFNNKITDNEITDSRDTVVWYSKDNLIARNTATRGRYALHFMYSQHNKVEYNTYYDNSVGIFLMYSDGMEVRHNKVMHSTGTTGMGIGFKETSDVTVEYNDIVYCAAGVYLDVSPYQPDTTNRILNNRIAYNGAGVLFHNDWWGNIIRGNHFEGNITQVAVQDSGSAMRQVWEGNAFDDYQGFDRDGDRVGDAPHEIYAYADRIWLDLPFASFFKGTPLLAVLDFLERLAPFSEPVLVMRDDKPQLDPTNVGSKEPEKRKLLGL